jgi:mono/diheme cytochrome c family protein
MPSLTPLVSAVRSRSVMALSVVLGAGCAVVAFGASDANLERARSQATYGSGVFERECADCHGPRGEGRGAAPPIMGQGALKRYPREDSTFQASYSGHDGQEGARRAPPPEFGRPEFVNAQGLQTYLVYHMPKIKKQPLTEQDYWAVVNFILLGHGIEVPADGISKDNGSRVAINPR